MEIELHICNFPNQFYLFYSFFNRVHYNKVYAIAWCFPTRQGLRQLMGRCSVTYAPVLEARYEGRLKGGVRLSAQKKFTNPRPRYLKELQEGEQETNNKCSLMRGH